MSTGVNGCADPGGSADGGNFTVRVGAAAGTRPRCDIIDGTDQDLVAHLRALGAGRPRRGVGPVFPDLVCAQARRHRSHVRVAALVATVLVIVASVGIPASLRLGGKDPASAVAAAGPASRDVPYTFGGMTVPWLPAAMAHDADLTGVIAYEAEAPLISSYAGILGGSVFVSRFVVPAAASTPGTAGLSTVWVSTVYPLNDDPAAATLPRIQQSLDANVTAEIVARNAAGVTEVSAATVGDQDATFVRNDLATATFAPSQDPNPNHRYGGLLTWPTASGALLAVEAVGPAPVDLEVLRQIGAGLVLGPQPSIAPQPHESPRPLEDAGIAAAVELVVHDAFTHDVPDERWVAAVEDGPALTALHAEARAHFPQAAGTLDVTIDSLSQSGPDFVSAQVTMSFTDPTVAVSEGMRGQGGLVSYPTSIWVVRTADGWKVQRSSYCASLIPLGVPELSCPHA